MRRRARLTARRPRWSRRSWSITALVLAAVVALSSAGIAAAFSGTTAEHPAQQAAPTASATPRPTQKPRPPTVMVYAGQGGVVAPASVVEFTVILNNTSASPISPGTVTINLTQRDLDTRNDLASWLAGSSDAAVRAVQSAPTAAVPIGGSSLVAVVSVPAASLGITETATADFGVSASVSANGAHVATGYSSIVWSPAPPAQHTSLAIAMPITVPPNTTGLISASELATYTSPDGVLTRQLDAVRVAPSVTLGIDPMIIASINVLGSSAPASARAWLADLATLPNETFALQYGDADAAAQLQAGLGGLWQPTSFDYAVNPSDFGSKLTVGETPVPTATAPSTPGATPTPTPTASGNPNVPNLEQVLSWPYSLHGVVWPADGTMTEQTATQLAKLGYPNAILSGANTNASSLKSTPDTAIAVPGGKALAADATVSAELRAAVYATTDDQRGAALAQLNSSLALIDAEPGASGRVVLATLERNWPSSWQRAAQTLSAVGTMQWIQPVTLAQAISSTPTSGLSIKDSPESGARLSLVRQLQGNGDRTADGTPTIPTGQDGIAEFATMLADPTQLTGPTRNSLLAVLGVGWLRPSYNWTQAAGDTVVAMQKTISSVQIVPTGNITVASAQGQIPITVTNEFRLPVNITLNVSPSNGRIEVDPTTEKQIPAGASGKVLVPVKARLGNGKVTLHMQLFTPPDATGAQYRVGASQSAAVDVHAEWEGIGALIIGLLAVLLFGFGLVRAILRRRTARRSEGAEGSEPGEDTPGPGPDDDTDGTGTDEGPGPDDGTGPEPDSVIPEAAPENHEAGPRG